MTTDSLLDPTNPFAAPSTLCYGMPHFDQIDDAHFAPAFEFGIQHQQHEVDVIATAEDAASFANTIDALEESGALLDRVSRVFYNLTSVNTNDALEELRRQMAPRLAAHRDAIFMNRALFARIEALFSKRSELALDSESQRLLERYRKDFVRAGALLSIEDQAKLRAMNGELASLTTQFSQNVLRDSRERAVHVANVEELDGMSASAIASAANAARARGLEHGYLLILSNTTQQALLATLTNRALRERIFQASSQRCTEGESDNRGVLLQIAHVRAARAALLGYANHAAYSLEDTMAGSESSVNRLLADLAPKAVANAHAEADAIQEEIDRTGEQFELEAWDWAFYSEKVRRERFAFDESEVRPYFELQSVLVRGVFFAASQCYGLSFKERDDLPTYHPDVTVYEIFDADDTPLALLLTDFYARDNKRGGAWMNSYVLQSDLLGFVPVVGNHLNVQKPIAGDATLLTFSEVVTLFHEFGHALHGIFSKVRYPLFSGTNVPRDFVEFPSQVNEMWAVWPEVLKNYAHHYRTGAAMPEELMDKILSASTFNEGFATTEYLSAAILDQAWHQLTVDTMPSDVLAFEREVLERAGINLKWVPPRYKSSYFGHIFSGGYAAGYYAYIWSEVLDADAVEWFRGNGGLQRRNGERLRELVLSRGGSVDPMEQFVAFRGQKPDITALLERRGLALAA